MTERLNTRLKFNFNNGNVVKKKGNRFGYKRGAIVESYELKLCSGERMYC